MEQRRLLFIFLFFALILMACNLTSMLPGSQTNTDPMAEPTPDLNVDELENELTQESEVIEDITSENESESVESSETSSPASTAPQSACDHPYFPLREGATWVYYDSSDTYYYHWEVVSVTGDHKNAEAVMQVFITEAEELNEDNKSAAIELEYNWVCSAEEGIVSFDMASLDYSDLGGSSFKMTMENVEGEGVMLPPADRLESGSDWEMTFNADFSVEGLIGATGNAQVNDFYTVLSNDPVEFNGETFEGLQYQREFNIDMLMTMNGVEVDLPNIDFDSQTFTVLAKGIGFVTLDSETDLGLTGLQLIRYNIP